jgi:hypothetical protein
MMIAAFGALIVWNGWYVRRPMAGVERRGVEPVPDR